MIQQFYLDIFERYHQRGLEAYRGGDAGTARRSFLKAAEVLFKLAAGSAGELQRVRKEKAQKLLDLAKSIDPDAPVKAAKGAAPARGSGKSPAAAEVDEGEGGGDQWIISSLPDVKMDEVAGLEDVKSVIRKRVIYPFQHPDVSRKYRKQAGGGVLLYGPPGTGKTMMAKAIAAEIDATFFSVKCSDIMTKWVGEAEKNLKRLFDAARQHPRAVVFMDETEAIVAKRGGDSTVMNRVIPEFLAQVDGLQGQHSGLLLLGATNRPWDMDEAALRPGRFGELIYVTLPDQPARHQILAAALKGIPLAEEIDVTALAGETDGYSGADLVALCEIAKDGPYEREIQTGVGQRLEVEDVAAAKQRVRPSVSKAQLARYSRFQETRQ
ncbi:MAG: ATP-binding protein [Planctomycetota bacterium]|nr:ATP-binding protein [Planctomycetota bacterium]